MCFEDLPISDGVLTFGRAMLVNDCIRAELEEIIDATDVVFMPMRYKSVRNGGRFGAQNGRQEGYP